MKRLLSLAVTTSLLVLGAKPAVAQDEARDAGYLYLSPMPNAPFVSAQTRFVLVRFENVNPSDVTNLTTGFITVTGASSGSHPGMTHVATDGRTVIFELSYDFTPNELVTVTLNPQLDAGAVGKLDPFEYQFAITSPVPGLLPPGMSSLSSPAPLGNLPDLPNEGDPSSDSGADPKPAGGNTIASTIIMPNGVSVPSDFPKVVITVNNDPSPGYLFLENGFPSGAPPYTMILDNNGSPVWYRRGRVWDFKIQKNGMITWCVSSAGGFLSFDQNFNYVQTYYTVNGYLTDYHEFELLQDGGYLMLGTRVNTVDMGQYIPGKGSVSATEGVIQEFTAAGELIFQWRAWDHYDIRDNSGSYDFPHMNALDIDEDGQILVSCRHMNEITKIDRDSGDIIWRLSGNKSDFTFVNDSMNGVFGQHDINALGNNRYTIFANAGGDGSQVSRAIEYQLDLTNMTATQVWEFRDSPDKFTHWMGNAQRLPSGNTLINFVRPYYPPVIEVDTNGVKHFELTLVPNTDHYRVFRLPWTGEVAVPYLIAELQRDNVTLVFNKFGDHTVDHYRIYGGTSPSPTNLLATSFTTLMHLTNVVNGVRNYFRVTAVGTNGDESDFSNEENLVVNISLPGQNMVLNGDFSQGTYLWTWQVTPPASALWDVVDGISHFEIVNGGTYITDVQLKQAGLKLTQGKGYTFEFDAWSAAPRTFEARVEQNADGGVNYSGIQPITITPVTNHFSFQFKMLDDSDDNARVVFNAGALPHDIYIANVSLRENVYVPGDFNWDGCVGFDDLEVLTGEWQGNQNPLTADLNGDGKVNFADFVIFSESWSGGGVCP